MPQVKASCDHLCPGSWSTCLSDSPPASVQDLFYPFAINAPKALLLVPLVFSLMAHSQEHLQAHVTGGGLFALLCPPLQDRNGSGSRCPFRYLPQPAKSAFSEPQPLAPTAEPADLTCRPRGSSRLARPPCVFSALGHYITPPGKAVALGLKPSTLGLCLAPPRQPPPQPLCRTCEWTYTSSIPLAVSLHLH